MVHPEQGASDAPRDAGWRFEHTYAALPGLFHRAVAPTAVRAPRMVIFNRRLAEELGLDAAGLDGELGAEIFSGNRLPPGARPLAQAYAGHQYGHFTGLGDGRALLLGEQVTPGGERFDIQLKGPGPTPFSRRGDGRAALGPMLREYVISEAMHALGIPTTRSLAVVATGEDVFRQSVLPGAVLTRVAASHVRVGTFQWAAAHGDRAALEALVDYTVHRHYPVAMSADNRALALLDLVIARQAELIARWMLVGFVHGVMNTDNMAVSGETIDYGPCAFMDAYDPQTVFSSIDARGRYAYGNQPAIAQWNLARLAEALLPLLHADEARAVADATSALQRFTERYEQHWLEGMRRKLGLLNAEAGDRALADEFLGWMQRTQADYTNTFAGLERQLAPEDPRRADAEFIGWHERWETRLARQPGEAAESDALRRAAAPAVIPRNHLVEAALAAAEAADLGPLQRLLAVVSKPFAHGVHPPEYRTPAPAGGPGYRTFCGT